MSGGGGGWAWRLGGKEKGGDGGDGGDYGDVKDHVRDGGWFRG